MLKKFLSIFKRDKTGFGKSELIFQKKIAKRIKLFVITVLLLGAVVCVKISSDTILVLYCWVAFTIGTIIFSFLNDLIKDNIEKQLREVAKRERKQRKEKQERELFEHIEKGEFLQVQFTNEFSQELLQAFLILHLIEINKREDTLEVSISEKMKNYPSIPFYHIKKDEISTYFKFTYKETILDDCFLDDEEEHSWLDFFAIDKYLDDET